VEALANTSHLEILELAAIGLALLLAVRGQCTWSGLALGLAVATKTLPAVFLPYLALTQRWRMLASAVALSAGLLLVVCWLQGVPPWDGALALVDQRGNLTDIEFTEYAYALRADVARILARDGGVLPPEQARIAIAVHWVVALSVMLVVGFALATVRHVRGHEGLMFGAIAATMLVIAPSAHAAYYIFLLPGLTAGLGEVLARDTSLQRLGPGLALLAGYVFSGFDQPFLFSQHLLGVGDVVPANWLAWHLPTLALLTTLATLCALLASTHQSQRGHAV
jgi:alpha-1,2-mannosyltransferase